MATMMTTEEYKTNFLDFLLKVAQNSAFTALRHQNIIAARSMNRFHPPGRSTSVSSQLKTTDAMVCVECFRSKGDGDLKIPCQNPRCHFYLQTPDDYHPRSLSESSHPPSSPSFSREVGHNRHKPKPKPRFSYSSDLLSSTSSQGDGVWAYVANQALYQSQQSNSGRIRSQSTSVGRENSQVLGHYQKVPNDRGLIRSRLMSMPVCSSVDIHSDQDNGLVEDAFLASPLPDENKGNDVKCLLGTPDTDIDSGISSPFGCSSFVIDWPDGSSRQTGSCPSHVHLASDQEGPSKCLSFDMNLLQLTEKNSSNPVTAAMSSSSVEMGERLSPPGDGTDLLKKFLTTGRSSETYSKKVFIGGLPPDIDEDEIHTYFLKFGSLSVDWPHKNHNKGCIPPKGYAFLLFKDEASVHKLLLACLPEGDKYFIFIPTSALGRKKVQIRPWFICDSQFTKYRHNPKTIDSRKAVFVGGVPRPLKASELADVMTEKYGTVAYVAIDCDSDLKYPKGAACVVFASHASYIAAVSARFMQLNHGNLDKKIEIKPYVLDGQTCDECHGVQCDGKPAPFFCGSVTCLQYYCEYCWATIHSIPGRQNHRPLLKDIGDKARFY